jgi:superfamily I DNA and RNA helicase
MGSSATRPATIQLNLKRAIASGKIEVIGEDDIKNDPQALVGLALVQAYGNSPAGFIYFEAITARGTAGPSDALLCHPEVGVLVVEVKGYPITQIDGVVAGNLKVRQDGRVKNMNVFSKTADKMFDIKNPVERTIRDNFGSPLFNYVVAFPQIKLSEWQARHFDLCVPCEQLLFEEDLNPEALRRRLASLTTLGLEKSGKKVALKPEHIEAVRRVLGDSAVINQQPENRRLGENTLGYIIAQHIADEKHLSREQEELSGLKVGHFPRVIRGVAGSGKTVVLANQVARYALRNGELFDRQEVKVAALCFNRTLVPFLREKITIAYRQRMGGDDFLPDIGIYLLNGLMFHLSGEKNPLVNYVPIKGLNAVPDPTERANKYRQQLAEFNSNDPHEYERRLFDAIFVDEGQDFEPEEYKLLLDLLRPDPETGERCLVVFYDDAQNLYARRRPNWKDDVGIDVGKGDRSRVMKECFRNTREIVDLAFNVLVGSKAPGDQRVQTRTFAQVPELARQGLIEESNGIFRVRFAERTFEPPAVRGFESRRAEKEWVASEIVRLVKEEWVKPEHILVVFHRKGEFQDLDLIIRERDEGRQIKGFIKPYEEAFRDSLIFQEGQVTLSTTFSAKGYDAYVVFVIGSDLFNTDNAGRASFYVGATRAKLRLYVTGICTHRSLAEEAEALSKQLATTASEPGNHLAGSYEAKNVDSPKPNGRSPIVSVPKKQEISRPPTPSVSAKPNVLQAFAPRFRRGDTVQHPHHGVGRVVEEGDRRYLGSEDRWVEDVRVQFGGTIRKLEAGSDGLVHVVQTKTS